MPKIRLDQLLVERGYAESRTQAQAMIISGNVYSEHSRLDKPGQQVPADLSVTVKGREHEWVSRGGMKLDKAIGHFNLSVQGAVAIDVGASTGGFTDVLLHHGAAKVYAVDVGHSQLAWKLRTDPRVVVLEKTNARYLDKTVIPEPVDVVVCDASFISLKTVLPAALALTKAKAILATLIKPQFEVGKEHVGKGGVVRDAALHQAVCDDIAKWVANEMGWVVKGIVESPITGPKGNKEFLLCAERI